MPYTTSRRTLTIAALALLVCLLSGVEDFGALQLVSAAGDGVKPEDKGVDTDGGSGNRKRRPKDDGSNGTERKRKHNGDDKKGQDRKTHEDRKERGRRGRRGRRGGPKKSKNDGN